MTKQTYQFRSTCDRQFHSLQSQFYYQPSENLRNSQSKAADLKPYGWYLKTIMFSFTKIKQN